MILTKSLAFSFRTGGEGFTLTELLVSVSVVSVLAAVAAPLMGDSLLRARVATTQYDLRVIADAVEVFAADRGMYPKGSTEPPIKFDTDYDARVALGELVGTYLPDSPEILADSFTERAVARLKDSVAYTPDNLPSQFGYGYFDYADFLVPPKEPVPAFGLVSFGPDAKDSGFGLQPVPGLGVYYRNAEYSPSNGLRSSGDLGVFRRF